MRRLALDIGSARIGVAVSDVEGRVATPLTVLDAGALAGDPTPLLRLVEDYEVGEVVVGLPLSLDGTEGPQARRVRETARRLAERLDAPLVFYDERLSTAEAERAMASTGADARKRRGAVDMVAATLVLQAYLESRETEDE